MEKFIAIQIILGNITIDDVPDKYDKKEIYKLIENL